MKNNFKNYLTNIIIFLPLISFFFGFYFDEDSAGGGGYKNDSVWIRKNIDIFLENNLVDAILHPDFFGNRSPLIYVLHKIFNPFFDDFEKYRICGFIIFLIGPIIFYHLLRTRYFETDKRILFFISSLIYLSPYYRTSAYWGLNENYGILTTILSFLFLFRVSNSNKFNFLDILGLIIFSSLTVYFDLKLLLVPIICFIRLMILNYSLKTNFYIIIAYFVLSLPYIFLVFYWGGIVPTATQEINVKTITSLGDLSNVYLIHIGYCATLISFYLLPIVLFTHKNILEKLKEMFKMKFTYFLLSLIIIYIIYNLFYFDFQSYTETNYWVGLGIVHKFSKIVTQNLLYREIITYIFFFFSFLLLIFFYYRNKLDILYLLYFFLISILLWPLMQEYFDPIIFVLAFSVFKSISYFTLRNSMILFIYYSIFLIIANIHYIRLNQIIT